MQGRIQKASFKFHVGEPKVTWSKMTWYSISNSHQNSRFENQCCGLNANWLLRKLCWHFSWWCLSLVQLSLRVDVFSVVHVPTHAHRSRLAICYQAVLVPSMFLLLSLCHPCCLFRTCFATSFYWVVCSPRFCVLEGWGSFFVFVFQHFVIFGSFTCIRSNHLKFGLQNFVSRGFHVYNLRKHLRVCWLIFMLSLAMFQFAFRMLSWNFCLSGVVTS